MKIALIKQDTYQDLYVCANRTDIDELLLSTQMRVGMFGLFSMYDADFYIVKEAKEKECGLWKKVLPQRVKIFQELPYKTLNQLEGMEFQCPGSDKPNGYYSVDVDSIDYDAYDVIISINISVPYRIVKKHPNVLWAYMIGEANFLQDKAYMGYDVSLNQLIRGCYDEVNGIIDFPYTFVGPDCLEKAVERIVGRKACKKGIYGEVNCVKERPVRRIPQFEPISDETGQPIVLHDQHIKDNLVKIYDSKYYLKVGGRHTRGNGVLEAISLGTVVLMSPDDLICGQVLPKDAWVFSAADATKKIKELDENSDLYQKLLTEERLLLKQFAVDYPMHNLENALLRKRRMGKANSFIGYSNLKYLRDLLKKGMTRIKKNKIQAHG